MVPRSLLAGSSVRCRYVVSAEDALCPAQDHRGVLRRRRRAATPCPVRTRVGWRQCSQASAPTDLSGGASLYVRLKRHWPVHEPVCFIKADRANSASQQTRIELTQPGLRLTLGLEAAVDRRQVGIGSTGSGLVVGYPVPAHLITSLSSQRHISVGFSALDSRSR